MIFLLKKIMKTRFFSFLTFLFITTSLIAQDVQFEWAVGLGVTNDLSVRSATIDNVGNVYTSGSFEGTIDFDPGPGVFNLSSNGMEDIYITKFDSAGNFVWVKRIGSLGPEEGYSITIDSIGNIYVTGSFYAWSVVDFDPGIGIYYLSSNGNYDVFVLKLSSVGNFIWAKSFGGNSTDGGNSIIIDDEGDIYISGYFNDTVDFDPGPGVYNLITNYYGYDLFVTKLDSLGNFIWANCMLGIGEFNAYCYDLAIGDKNNLYITGELNGTVDFDPDSIGTSNLTSNGESDIFLSKLDVSGIMLWTKSIGGFDYDYSWSIKIDVKGNVYITGSFEGTVDFDPGSGVYNLTSNGFYDIYISKFDPAGNFVWAKGIGGIEHDLGYSLTLDTSRNIYIAGEYGETVDFDPGLGIFNLTSIGYDDIFISKFDSLGNFVWAKSIGGNSSEGEGLIFLDTSQNIYTIGSFYGTADFDPGPLVYNLTPVSSYDYFILKLSQSFYISDNILNVSCFGGSDAAIDISPYYGTPPYAFLWSNGQTTENISNLQAGTYYLTINDAAGDTIIDTFQIIQPAEIIVASVSFGVSSSTASDAFINLIVSGGISPYTFLWSNGETSSNIDSLSIGNYSVVVSDMNFCTVSDTFEIEIQLIDSQIIALPVGWRIFSTYMIPINPDIQNILSPIVSDIEMVKSGTGLIYWPAFSINQIGNLTLGQGYQIKTLISTNLIVYGSICEPAFSPVSINSGWNLIGYLRTSPSPIGIMLSSIVNEIVLVKNGLGEVFWPIYNVNNIGNMVPGEGYQVKMTNTVSLTYPGN